MTTWATITAERAGPAENARGRCSEVAGAAEDADRALRSSATLKNRLRAAPPAPAPSAVTSLEAEA